MRLKIPAPMSGGLVLSYRCCAQCLHCMYGCSPRWSEDWLPEADLEAMLGQLAPHIQPSPAGPRNIGLSHGLHFTGGEPFLNIPLLTKAVTMAGGLGIPSLFVETNCFWCKDDAQTRDTLMQLKDQGLHGIMISVNPFYLEFIPFERTQRCIEASLAIFGNNTAVYQVEYYRRFQQWGISGKVPIAEYFDLEDESRLFRDVEFFLNGRAVYGLAQKLGPQLSRHFAKHPARAFLHQPCIPEFVRSWHNHFDNYGHYVPGFCGGISYGDCRNLDTLLRDGIDAEAQPVLALLMAEDMAGLLDLAVECGFSEDPAGYFSKCHLCLAIRRHLAEQDNFSELAPIEFYTHLGV